MQRLAAILVPRGSGGLPLRARRRVPRRTDHRSGAAPTVRAEPRERRILLHWRRRRDGGEVAPRSRLARSRGARRRKQRGGRRLGPRDFSDARAMGRAARSVAVTGTWWGGRKPWST